MTHLNSPATVEPAAGAPILVLEKLDKRFGGTHALKAVDLAFDEGEIHAIVGENGAGKSTLIKLLTGVHRARPARCTGAARRSLSPIRTRRSASASTQCTRKSFFVRI
jgi:ABC-type sugar transport system ATPase subunit